MSEYYGAPNDFRNYLQHYGVKGMKWGKHKRLNDDNQTAIDRMQYYTSSDRTKEANRRNIGRNIAGAVRDAITTQQRNDNMSGASHRRNGVRNRISGAVRNAINTQQHNDAQSGRNVRRNALNSRIGSAVRNVISVQAGNDRNSRNTGALTSTPRKRRKRSSGKK